MGRLLEELIVRYKVDNAELKTGLKQVKDELSSVSSAASRSGDGLLSGFKKAGGGLLDFGVKVGQTIFGLQGLAQGAMGFGEALIGPNASMEQTQVAFETLLGKGKKTSDFLKQMQQFAASTPFEFPELATDAEHMLAFGFAAKDIKPDLTAIGDAMGAMGKSNADIDHIVEVFGQMHAAGKLNAGDMMQLSDEGIPAWKMLAAAMGKTVPEVQKLSSQGLIPADKAIKAVTTGMEKMFGGGMQAQSQTFNGLLSTFKDNINQALMAFTGPLFSGAKQALTTLGNLVSSQKFQDFATMMGQKVGDAIGFVAGKVQDMLPSLQDIGNAFQGVGNFVESNFLPPVRQIFDIAGQIIENFIKWNDKTHFLQNTLQDAGLLLKRIGDDVAQKLMPPVRDAIAAFQQWLSKSNVVHDALGLVGDVIDKVTGLLGGLIKGLSGVFGWFGQSKDRADALKLGIEAIGGAIIGIKIVKFGQDVFNTLKSAGQSVRDFIGTIGKIGDKLGDVLGFFKDKFAPGASKALGDVGKTADATSKSELGMGTAANTAEAEVAADSSLMDRELGGVGKSALIAEKDITGIGPAAGSASVSAVGAFSGLAAGILSAGITAIVGLEAYMLQNASPALAESWLNNNYRPPSGPGGVHPARHALGTSFAPGGPSIVAEDGAELVMGPRYGYLPRGSQVFNHSDTMKMANGNYPVGSSSAGSSGAAGAGGNSGGSRELTVIVEVDSVQWTKHTMMTADRIVRVKLGPGGRAA
jgi:tape measure domain-containing protein